MLKAAFVFSTVFIFAADVLAAEKEHGEKSSGGLPQLDLTWWPSQIFWLGITFIILYSIFSGRILPRMAANMSDREQLIRGDLDEAEKLTNSAGSLQATYEERLESARLESAQIMAQLDQDMRKEHEQKQIAFQKKAEERISEIKKTLEKSVTEAMKNIETHIEETALIAAKNIAGIDTDGKAVKAALKAINSNIKAEAA